jgi:hypothetical protein
VAVYSGNSPNTNDVTHNAACTDTEEDVTVTSVPSKITTTQNWVPNDSATVSADAGGHPVGTVSFDLFASGDCTGASIYHVTQQITASSSPTVSTSNTVARPAGTYSWLVSFDSTNGAQRDFIPGTCHETSSLTIANGGTVSSP